MSHRTFISFSNRASVSISSLRTFLRCLSFRCSGVGEDMRLELCKLGLSTLGRLSEICPAFADIICWRDDSVSIRDKDVTRRGICGGKIVEVAIFVIDPEIPRMTASG